jgi:hypothetical protein
MPKELGQTGFTKARTFLTKVEMCHLRNLIYQVSVASAALMAAVTAAA